MLMSELELIIAGATLAVAVLTWAAAGFPVRRGRTRVEVSCALCLPESATSGPLELERLSLEIQAWVVGGPPAVATALGLRRLDGAADYKWVLATQQRIGRSQAAAQVAIPVSLLVDEGFDGRVPLAGFVELQTGQRIYGALLHGFEYFMTGRFAIRRYDLVRAIHEHAKRLGPAPIYSPTGMARAYEKMVHAGSRRLWGPTSVRRRSWAIVQPASAAHVASLTFC